MGEFHNIPIRLEDAPWSAGNATPILHEIRHALLALLESGQETIIDLHSLPISPADETQLRDALGQGEVEARFDVLGKSIVRETRLPGVWFVDHYNADGHPVGRFIEITLIPAILKAQPEDIQEGIARLTEQLAASDDRH